jgi:hypothetical protein
MISIQDCIDYSDLTEDEVRTIADHEHVPFEFAAQLACCLAQTTEGTDVLRCLLTKAVSDAAESPREEALLLAQRALQQFLRNHPG